MISSPLIVTRLSQLAATIALAISPFYLNAEGSELSFSVMRATDAPKANLFQNNFNDHAINTYLASEKLDGIRAIWTGKQLVTRKGNLIHAPTWFTAALPDDMSVEGELWLGRKQFQSLSSIVLDTQPNDDQWKNVKFMLFDSPSTTGGFQDRLNILNQLVSTNSADFIQVIPQQTLLNSIDIDQFFTQVEQLGGEGIMLHHQDNPYQAGQSTGILKVKSHQDSEAIVVGYEPGSGKYVGMMGSVWVLTADNIRFKIGSGFRDVDRKKPPEIGSIIQFRYNGYTDRGIPRFARYVRVRHHPDS
ncbi:DNA ligase [Photobacterium nomapromontoriensis]|uniref:DNA ligase n=1 Tax=Photobacterium nomapromontoriensis TaxID=2910237 RepID=UPI003D134CD7